MTESFYDLLGVSADADVDEIQQAYRQRIKETHPDVSDDPDASEKTAQLVEARDVLTDEDERARYDRLGHDAYVGGGFGADDDESSGPWTSRAAAKEAGSSSTGDGSTNARASAEERRHRERRAREEVNLGGGSDAGSSASTDGASGADATANDGTATKGGTVGNGGSTTNGGTASNSGAATNGGATMNAGAATNGGTTQSRRGGSSATATRGPPPWSDASQGWAARTPTSAPPGLATQVFDALLEAPATALVTFLLYPLLVLGAFLPAFPLAVNLIVGVCLLAMIAASQSVPGLGVAIYGVWTLVGTGGVIAIGASPFSPLGLVVLGTTWLPLGFSVLTYHVLDS